MRVAARDARAVALVRRLGRLERPLWVAFVAFAAFPFYGPLLTPSAGEWSPLALVGAGVTGWFSVMALIGRRLMPPKPDGPE